MRAGRVLEFALVAALSASVAHAGEPGARGAELLQPFKRELMQALKKGLAQGPEEAVAACREQAPGIAARLSTEGVEIGRASHRLRNPANRAPEWVAPLLQAYVDDVSARAPRTVALAGGRTGYVEPIATKALCLTCHGETLAPALAARIRALYPEDRAVGFREGELRGVFWVSFPNP